MLLSKLAFKFFLSKRWEFTTYIFAIDGYFKCIYVNDMMCRSIRLAELIEIRNVFDRFCYNLQRPILRRKTDAFL